MHYNASVVHPPRERERFRMNESRDAADTEMLSANAPVWPGNGGSPIGILLRPSRFCDSLEPFLKRRSAPRLSIYNIIMIYAVREKKREMSSSEDTIFGIKLAAI